MNATSTENDRGSTLWLVALGAIVLIGALLRISQIDQSLVADEMWSYTSATRPNFGSMLDFVRSDEEITPPLFTILAWLSARIGNSASVLRLPSVVPGILIIPLVYGIGRLALGQRVALTAAALAALSPFLIWQSVELRAYSLAIMFVAASTLFLLVAIKRRHWPWWAGYAFMTSAAMYSHYTAFYPLAAQFAWVVLFHPSLRRQVLLASAAAAAAYLPWIPSALDDLSSPSQDIYGKLAPFGFHNAVEFTAQFAVGLPGVGLHSFYGRGPEILLVVGITVAVVGLLLARKLSRRPIDEIRRDNVVLLAMLALAAPVGVAFVSFAINDQFLPRNLSTSAPGALLVLAYILMAGTFLVRLVSTVLVMGVFAFGAVRSTEPRFQRYDYKAAAAFIDSTAAPEDVVLDTSLYVSGKPPTYTLDINFDRPHNAIDAVTPEEILRSRAEAAGARLYIVGQPFFVAVSRGGLGLEDQEPVEERTFQGIAPLIVQVFAIPKY